MDWASIIISGIAALVSIIALVISFVKINKENKLYKQNYLINHLVYLRNKLSEEFTNLELQNSDVEIAMVFNQILNENFNYYDAIQKICFKAAFTINNIELLLNTYNQTDNCVAMKKVIDNLIQDNGYFLQICMREKDKKNLLKKYVAYQRKFIIREYISYKTKFLLELNNRINFYVKNNVSVDEICKELPEYEIINQ